MRINRTTLAGVVLGVLGAGLLTLFVVDSGSSQDEPTVPAFVVAGDLEAGMRPEELASRVERRQLPESLAPAHRVRDLDEVAGRELVRPVGEGEVLTTDQLAEPGPAAGGLVVPAGYEALSVEAEPAPGVQGYVTPGDRVNVYVTVEPDDEDGAAAPENTGSFTQLVLGHVDVLAVTRGTLTGESQSAEDADAADGVVLLLQVRPPDAPVLVHARRNGELWFSLVNPDDPAPPAERVGIGAFAPTRRTEAIRQADQARQQQPAEGQAQQTQGAGQPTEGANDE